MNETEEDDDEELEWNEILSVDPLSTRTHRPHHEEYSWEDIDAEDRSTPTHEELDTTLEYEIDDRGRTNLRQDTGVWGAIKLTFGPDSYLSTKTKAAIAGVYAFAIIGVPLLAWGFAKGMTAWLGSPMIWYGLALIALAVYYIKWAGKVLSA